MVDLTDGKLMAQNEPVPLPVNDNNNQGLLAGIGDFFNSPFFKGKSVIDPESLTVTNTPSGLNQALGVGNFALGVHNFLQQKDFMDDQMNFVNKQNRQQILAQLENANQAMGSREYNRLRMQGLSEEDARAGADEFVSKRGLQPEQFGVKEFKNA